MSRETIAKHDSESIEGERPAWGEDAGADAGDGRAMTRIRGLRAVSAEERGDAFDDVPPAPEAPAPIGARSAEASRDDARATAPSAGQVSDHFAAHLADTSGAVFMYASMASVLRQADLTAFKKFRDKLLADCGGPTDPVEVMLVEQLALAHLNVGRLHFKSATVEGLEAAKVYGGLAVLLMGEFRRTALALQAYRAPARGRAASAGEAAMSPGAVAPDGSNVEGADIEQGNNPGGDEHGDGTIPLPEPEAGGGGPQESREAARARRRRA
ncbi:hypothetical protein [Paludisphaera mucosa]|uniref:Carboxymuconolactone decarboxylase-like domain-containing protein n=1 Tax=Paludisphaera mucosa TaxID=3030827 RepID=A0ABT6FEV5_9BACT|nr:hypothetical protein [Paludisphaera mucosa]MDG3005905.1 hypothetical protein [Paludisphaera mucosa]